ncbi:hypothetical protein I5Q83_06160 [Enterocloster clostridioformis]|uniref:hypothetical protein n=1 Tax=Enterocloster clostridioformis TaxID=1531 RepID=UPI000A4FB48B|nr:hypothetical protein [Enterocloster clostridioformis]QQR01890.1 hypothetical protein I5Q83_06160 [Enterocloster clostridioformis]
MKKDAVKLAKQVAGTMAIEGMKLKQSEYNQLLRCANGQQSTSATIKKAIRQYTVK